MDKMVWLRFSCLVAKLYHYAIPVWYYTVQKRVRVKKCENESDKYRYLRAAHTDHKTYFNIILS